MSIPLTFAYEGLRLRHISERLEKHSLYTCPFCHSYVIPKKGQSKQHHFSHKHAIKCEGNQETVLHFESKHFVRNSINEQKELTFSISKEQMNDDIQRQMNKIRIHQYPLSLNELSLFYGFNKAICETTPIENFIADVLVVCEDRKPFVFEIFVNHALSEEKKGHYQKEGIEYLEIIPFHYYQDNMIFLVNDVYIPSYFLSIQENIKA